MQKRSYIPDANKRDKIIRILLIEDSPDDARLLEEFLIDVKNFFFKITWITILSEGLKRVQSESFDVILLDLTLPDSKGLETFRKTYSEVKDIPIIVLSGFGSDEIALNAVQEGAQDYISKGIFNGQLLANSIRYAIERYNLQEKLNNERKKNEQELIKVQKLESLGILAGGIAHDFNNILTAILGNISLARFDMEDHEKLDKLLLSSERAAYRAKSLTQQLLVFSKSGIPIKKPVAVDKLFREITIFALRGTNVRCSFNFPENLWISEADNGQLSQVINNIILNAVQAMPNGGEISIKGENVDDIEREGKIFSSNRGKFIKFSISDNGVGIKPEHFPYIFDPYFTTKKEGSGLGLAMSFSIIKKHGGYITLDSKLGIGTSFYVYLPASSKKIETKKEIWIENNTDNLNILVMDDKDYVRKILEKMLDKLGHKSDFVEEGSELIDIYTNALESGNKYDLIITDLTIPGGMGGKNAIKILKKIDPFVVAIVTSGFSEGVLENYKKYGFAGILQKPFTFHELKVALSSVMKNKSEKHKTEPLISNMN
ncbi:MAG: hybrid sensor histidine kinase/response regulator [Promethearchaeota archaeon]